MGESYHADDDALIREAGYIVYARPKDGEPIWCHELKRDLRIPNGAALALAREWKAKQPRKAKK